VTFGLQVTCGGAQRCGSESGDYHVSQHGGAQTCGRESRGSKSSIMKSGAFVFAHLFVKVPRPEGIFCGIRVSQATGISKNDVISSIRKHYCALGLGFVLGIGLGLAEIRFRSNMSSSKCRRTQTATCCYCLTAAHLTKHTSELAE